MSGRIHLGVSARHDGRIRTCSQAELPRCVSRQRTRLRGYGPGSRPGPQCAQKLPAGAVFVLVAEFRGGRGGCPLAR